MEKQLIEEISDGVATLPFDRPDRLKRPKRQIAIVNGEKILKTARCMVSAVGIELRPLPCEGDCQSNRTANFIAIQRLNPIANHPFLLPYRGHAKGQFRGLSSEK
jgi:hypothetical protein